MISAGVIAYRYVMQGKKGVRQEERGESACQVVGH